LNDIASSRLSRESVLRAALALLNEVGMDGLSTRRLADKLGVQSPTLYWHFKNKAELLAAMAETIMQEQHQQALPRKDQPWQEWCVANAHSFRKGLLAYRDGARLHAGTRPRGAHLDAIEAKLGVLCVAGFSPEQAVGLMVAISRFVVGWVLEEQAEAAADHTVPANAPDAQAHPLLVRGWQQLLQEDPDQAFDRHVRYLVAGVQALPD
jgi:TetR/AcrR family tetracycline transcriptional repressor